MSLIGPTKNLSCLDVLSVESMFLFKEMNYSEIKKQIKVREFMLISPFYLAQHHQQSNIQGDGSVYSSMVIVVLMITAIDLKFNS